MAIKDPIREIVEEFEDKIFLFKKERENALANFKKVIHIRKVEDIKTDLKSNADRNCKK